MKKASLLAAALAVSLPGLALAQPQVTTGFPIGEKSRIHTGLGVAAVFDSNPDRLGSTDANSDWSALVRPNVSVDVPGTDFSLHGNGDVSISQYFGTNGNPSKTLVGTFLGAVMDAGSETSLVGFHVDDQLVRTPTYIQDLGAVAAEERRFALWNNRGSAVLSLRPGGGALSLDFGYTNYMSFYDVSLLGSSQRHGALFEAKLRFLPKTALFFHGDMSFFSTSNDIKSGTMPTPGNSGTFQSTPYNVAIGLIGQITTRLSGNFSIGFGDSLTWQNGFFNSIAQTENRNVIGRAELTVELFEGSRISVGYLRQVVPIVLLDNYTSNQIYSRLAVGITNRLSLGGFFEYEFRNYSRDAQSAQIMTADARLDYWFFDFLSAGINYRLLRQSAGTASGMPTANYLIEDYTRHMVFIGVSLRY